jgi:hypothetical protein
MGFMDTAKAAAASAKDAAASHHAAATERRAEAAAIAAATPTPVRNEVQVKTYKSGKDFEKDANKMLANGWALQDQSTRTKKWSVTTGLFTNKGITTVTYVRAA